MDVRKSSSGDEEKRNCHSRKKRQTDTPRFKAITEFVFCVPKQPNVPASINRFAIRAGKSDHSRDLILEAYNAEGQILATVESSNRQGVFFGVESNEPIYRIRLRSNPYLRRVNRVVDEKLRSR